MKPIYVIGHRNPDTDSICSAIAYAHLKNQVGEHAKAARAGGLNAETRYILKYFNEPWPELVDDFYPRARDVMILPPETVRPEDTLWKLGQIISGANIKSIPVLAPDGSFAGIVSVGDLAKRFFAEMASLDFSQTGATFRSVLEVVNGKVLAGEQNLGSTLEGRLKIAGSSLEVIEKSFSPGDIVLVGDRYDVHELCIRIKVSAIILTGSGGNISQDSLAAAAAAGIVVIRCPYDTYTSARLLTQSIPVKAVMQKDVVAFSPNDLLQDVKERILDTHFRNYPVLEKNRLAGMINRNSLIMSEQQKVILVDHNERSQAVEGIEYAKITEIIDHHRLGGLSTNEPIFIQQEPVGCTATIIAGMYWNKNIYIPPKIAGLLLSAILSDTVLFKSPTTTSKDKSTAQKLATIAKLDIKEHGMQLLKEGADLSKQPPHEIIRQDMKEFQLGRYRISASQVYVMDNTQLPPLRADLEKVLGDLLRQENYNLSLLMVTNIMSGDTDLLAVGPAQRIIQHAFDLEPENNVYHLRGMLSRKKQLIPPLALAVQELST